MDLDDIERSFKSLLSEVDKAFATLRQRYGNEVRCEPGCDDCCHAVFSVSLVEASFIEQYLREHLLAGNPVLFERLAERAIEFRKEQKRLEKELPVAGNDPAASEEFGRWRIRCPMLDDASRCAIYDLRPLTCRAYGLPLSINGRGHVCGLSGFARGQDYPTIKMDNIHRYLLDLSKELAAARGLAPAMTGKREFLADLVLKVAAEKR